MRVKLVALLVAASSVVLLTGCAGSYPYITEGTVVDKNYTEAYEMNTLECGSFGANGLCSMWYTQNRKYDEKWSVTIENAVEGETVSSTYSVTETEWENVQVGDEWEAPAREE